MKTELKWGVIFSLVSLGWVTGEYLAGFHDRAIDRQATVSMLFMFPAIAMILMAIRERRRLGGGRITFVEALFCGIGVSLVVALLGPLQEYIFHRFINPHFFEKMIEYSLAKGKMNAEEARSYFSLRSFMLQSSMGAIGLGSLTSLILAALMRTKNGAGR